MPCSLVSVQFNVSIFTNNYELNMEVIVYMNVRSRGRLNGRYLYPSARIHLRIRIRLLAKGTPKHRYIYDVTPQNTVTLIFTPSFPRGFDTACLTSRKV